MTDKYGKCPQCGTELTDKTFKRYSGKIEGLCGYCLKCPRKHNRIYTKRYYIAVRKTLSDLKINGCAKCGYDRCQAALDFHHTNPEDKRFRINLRNIALHSRDRIIDELNKCILLCSNCHREIEYMNTMAKSNENRQ